MAIDVGYGISRFEKLKGGHSSLCISFVLLTFTAIRSNTPISLARDVGSYSLVWLHYPLKYRVDSPRQGSKQFNSWGTPLDPATPIGCRPDRDRGLPGRSWFRFVCDVHLDRCRHYDLSAFPCAQLFEGGIVGRCEMSFELWFKGCWAWRAGLVMSLYG